MIIAILGRQSALGRAELESLYGAQNVTPLGTHAAMVNAEVTPSRLGGTIKLARPLVELPTTDWRKLAAHTEKMLPEHIAHLPEGKIKLGLSAYGLNVTAQHLFRAGLELKKIARAQKRSVRIVPSEGTTLNSAAVLHNGLTGELGIELNYIQNGNKTWIAQTVWVQDVDDYSRRDFGRPKRDAFVGMLPPKLAQTMLNLAQAQAGERILDPFCGTGVVLQEAALLDCEVYGTDLQDRMVDYSQANLNWLRDMYGKPTKEQLKTDDATTAKWDAPIDHIVCETYLGQPLSGLPKPEKLQSIISDCNTIITKFLQNAHSQLAPGTRICVAVPAWRVNNAFKHLALLDRLESLGYNRLRFQHSAWDEFIYHREDQIVARELLVLTVI
jgi:tRNA G10  N-methylase Trm11